MKRNFVQHLLIALGNWEDQFIKQHNFFGRTFVTQFLVEIFNFITYANSITTAVTA